MARDDDDGAHLVFVYGTLKRGFPNHGVVADLAARGDAALVSGAARTAAPPAHPALVLGPWGVPFLLPVPGPSPVSGELLSLSPRALALLDRFEGVPLSLYERRPISISIPAPPSPSSSDEVVVVEAEAYYAHRSYAAEMWRRCGERAIEGGEYTPDAARAYVTRPERPSDTSLLDEVRRFLAPRD